MDSIHDKAIDGVKGILSMCFVGCSWFPSKSQSESLENQATMCLVGSIYVTLCLTYIWYFTHLKHNNIYSFCCFIQALVKAIIAPNKLLVKDSRASKPSWFNEIFLEEKFRNHELKVGHTCFTIKIK